MKFEVEIDEQMIREAVSRAVSTLVRAGEWWGSQRVSLSGELAKEVSGCIQEEVLGAFQKLDVAAMAREIMAADAIPTIQDAIRTVMKAEAKKAVAAARAAP